MGLLLLLLAGVDIAFALAGLGAVLLLAADLSPLLIPQAMMSSMDNFILLAVPLFILMANVLLRGGAGDDLFNAVQTWVGHWPGGLAVATILSCAIFSSISGNICKAKLCLSLTSTGIVQALPLRSIVMR